MSAAITVLAFVLALLFVWWLRRTGVQPPPSLRTDAAPLGIVSLQVAGTIERADAILRSWKGSRLENARRSIFVDWFPFIPGYVAVLTVGVAAGAALLERSGGSPLASAGRLLAWLVLVAGFLDATENIFLLCMIDARAAGQPVAGPACPVGSAVFAWPKILVLGAAVLYMGMPLALRLWRGKPAFQTEAEVTSPDN
jgi:hypothetical protein